MAASHRWAPPAVVVALMVGYSMVYLGIPLSRLRGPQRHRWALTLQAEPIGRLSLFWANDDGCLQQSPCTSPTFRSPVGLDPGYLHMAARLAGTSIIDQVRRRPNRFPGFWFIWSASTIWSNRCCSPFSSSVISAVARKLISRKDKPFAEWKTQPFLFLRGESQGMKIDWTLFFSRSFQVMILGYNLTAAGTGVAAMSWLFWTSSWKPRRLGLHCWPILPCGIAARLSMMQEASYKMYAFDYIPRSRYGRYAGWLEAVRTGRRSSCRIERWDKRWCECPCWCLPITLSNSGLVSVWGCQT
jgi:hypothetical protein